MRKYLFLFFVLFAFVAACEPVANTPDDVVVEPELELTSANKLRVNRDGGEFEITYSLTNPVEGKAIKTTIVNSAMITAAEASVAGVVTITVSENTTDALREGAVIVSYGALSFTVVVEQD